MEELIVKERKFKEKIVKVINDSDLPAFIIKPTLKELLENIDNLEKQQYEKAIEIIKNKKTEANK